MSFKDEFAKRNNRPREVMIAGYPCKVRRASLKAWLMAGLVPQELAEELIRYAPQEDGDGGPQAQPDPAEAIELGRKLQRLKIELSIVEPRITFDPAKADPERGIYCVDDLEDPSAFIEEALTIIDGLPLATVAGEVPAEALNTFRQNGDWTPEPFGARSYGAHLRPAAE